MTPSSEQGSKRQATHVESGAIDGVYRADVDTSEVDEKKLLRKIDMRLIPWLSLLYLLSFLDRTSIGNAKVRHRLIPIYQNRAEWGVVV